MLCGFIACLQDMLEVIIVTNAEVEIHAVGSTSATCHMVLLLDLHPVKYQPSLKLM